MPAINAKPRFSSQRLCLLALAVLLIFVFSPASRAQDSPAPTPAAPASNATTQSPAPDAPPKPAVPAKPKHVITNDDIEPRSTANPNDAKFIPGESPLLNCDPACEREAQNELGVDASNEAEWRIQIVKARRDLIEDSQWRGLLNQAIQQSNTYCNFLLQQSQQSAPTGNDYRSQVQRSRNAEYFENMGRTLRQGLEAAMNRMQQHIQEVQVLSPVRAALMYVQGTRIFDRTCEMPGKR